MSSVRQIAVAVMISIFSEGLDALAQDANHIPGGGEASFTFDPSSMVPLRSHAYRKNDFCVSLGGSAILGDEPYEIHFDTGSWTTCLPYGCIDKTKVKVLEKDVKDSWGVLSDKVQGQLILTSHDGKTRYIADDYIFFARKKANGDDADCDRKAKWGNSIMGGFPGISISEELPSLPHVLALKYAEKDQVGYGIVTDSHADIEKNWGTSRSYLQIGSDPKITRDLNWRTDIPQLHHREGFSPGAIPGFKITFSFPKENGVGVPDIIVPGLWATVDSGAPQLTMRLGETNPHRSKAYGRYFTDEGPSWRQGQYKADSLFLSNGVNVRVEFEGSTGKASHYEFRSSADFGSPVPTQVVVGDWEGMVPWHVEAIQTPRHRFNLGNTIYAYCPVYFWDITNKRVGLHDFVCPNTQ